ncbi:MAG TPA: chromosome condensation regulator RCC1 [Polyangia bacterium]
MSLPGRRTLMKGMIFATLLGACSARGLPLLLVDGGAPETGPIVGPPDLAWARDLGVADLAVPRDLAGHDLALRDLATTPDLSVMCNSIGDTPPSAATQISAGDDAVCALVAGGAKCWGSNIYGVLGDGTYMSSRVPVDVSGLSSGVAFVSVGGQLACAATTAGAVECWGYNFGSGNSPVAINSAGFASGVVSVAAGGNFACAVTSAGAAMCWGRNHEGELGNGTTTDSNAVPVAVTGLSSGVRAVAAGDFHACAITGTGGVKCWGANTQGQLGNNSTLNSAVPVDVVGLSSGAVAITAGVNHTCAIMSTGGARCWGSNYYGEVGNPASDGMVPADVVGLSSGVISISAGNLRTCAATSAGAVRCWGAEANDSLVNATDVPVDAPCVSSGVVAVAVGNLVTCAMTRSGTVECWGSNRDGALGNDSTLDSPVPVEVVGL